MRDFFRRFRKISPTNRILLSMLLLSLILLSGWVTFAAYVSRSYVKGVAATARQEFTLSSDYLSVVSREADSETYPVRRIMLTEKEDTDSSAYSFSFSITNTADGSVSTKRIQYTLKVSRLPEGATLQYGGTDIKADAIGEDGYIAPVMHAYTTVTHTYIITIPKEQMTSAADIIVTATPDEDSDSSGFILAGRLQPSIIGTVATFSYEGILLETGNVADYAAFNYQISVSNAVEGQQMKLAWNKDSVEIDPLFIENYSSEGHPIMVQSNAPGELTITILDSNYTDLIQFYRMPGGVIQDWINLSITFEPVN
ncbi:MAG: hypothetical protein ACI4FY_08645 [Acetatifactor sp.]